MILELFETLRVTVLVVPVYPMKETVFQQHFHEIKKFSIIALDDLTPLSSAEQDKFTDHIASNGCICYNFVSGQENSTNNVNGVGGIVGLEELFTHQQVLCVVGLMDCSYQENIIESYKKFDASLSKYQNMLASRCIAFNRLDTQEDDLKGPVVIPSVGDRSFYLSTIMNDLTTDLLKRMSKLAEQIERRPLIQGPLFNTKINPDSPDSQSTSGSPGSKQDDGPSNANSNSLSFVIPTFTGDKGKKRTQGRANKMIADLYLMANKPDVAIAYYTQAIEISKSVGDGVWQGFAMEGHMVASLVAELKDLNIMYIKPASDYIGDASILITFFDLMAAATQAPSLEKVLSEYLDKFRDMIQLFERYATVEGLKIYSLFLVRAYLKAALFMESLYNAGFTNFVPSGYQLPAPLSSFIGVDVVTQTLQSTAKDRDGNPITSTPPLQKHDIGQWLMKAWSSGLEYLPLITQIDSVSQFYTLCFRLGFKRKAVFFLKQLSLLVQGSKPMVVDSGLRVKNNGQDNTNPISNSIVESDVPYLEFNRSLLLLMKQVVNLLDSVPQPVIDEPLHPLNLPLSHGWSSLIRSSIQRAIGFALASEDLESAIHLVFRLFSKLNREETSEILPEALYDQLETLAARYKVKNDHSFKHDYTMLSLKNIFVRSVANANEFKSVPLSNLKHGQEAKKDKDVFIYSSAKITASSQPKSVPAKRPVTFTITLDNPHRFDLSGSIEFIATGVEFVQTSFHFTIPAQTQEYQIHLDVTPMTAGTLEIQGCKIGILKGTLTQDVFLMDKLERSLAKTSEKYRVQPKLEFLKPPSNPPKQQERKRTPLVMTIIEELPLLEVTTGENNNNIMIFEGERVYHGIILKNISQKTMSHLKLKHKCVLKIPTPQKPVSSLQPDSNGASNQNPSNMTTSSGSQKRSAEEVYENDVYYPSLQIVKPVRALKGDETIYLDDRLDNFLMDHVFVPNESMIIEVEITGVVRCQEIQFIMEYASLEDKNIEDPNTMVYLSLLYHSVSTTVNAAFELTNFEVNTFTNSGFQSPNEFHNVSLEEMMLCSKNHLENLTSLDHFIFSFDIKNVWNKVFHFELYAGDIRRKELELSDDLVMTDQVENEESDTDNDIATPIAQTSIFPGGTKRLMIPLKKFRLPNTTIQCKVPSSSSKQYVVGEEEKLSKEQDMLRRKLFWYRHHFIGDGTPEHPGLLKAIWRLSDRRKGQLTLRQLQVNKWMVDVIEQSDILIDYHIIQDNNLDPTNSVSCDDPVQIQFSFTNESDKVINIKEDMEPQDLNHNFDERHFVVNGPLSFHVDLLKGQESTTTHTIQFFSAGEYKLLLESSSTTSHDAEQIQSSTLVLEILVN